METFRKSDHRRGRILYEVAGLRWLRAAYDADPSAVPIVEVIRHGDDWLEEPRLAQAQPTPATAEDFGRRLAHTHAAGADWLGAPPPGDFGQGWMGMTPLPLPASAAESTTSWGEFYAQFRIEPWLHAKAFTESDRAVIQKLCDKLASGALDHDQPALVNENGAAAARIHGDMWSGNLMWTPDGVVLIDPAAQGNHAEEDLASLDVFGAPYTERIWAAYDEESPLADGWRERIDLHKLHMLMIHVELFGRGYVGETVAIARRYA